MRKTAIIIGAGPAGLTAAYELLTRTDIIPVILEKSGDIGGISKTINYKGNRMDMGPHRFFSKSDRVMDWWLNIMTLENGGQKDIAISYQNKSRNVKGKNAAPEDPDKVMLVINRLTRIYFLRKFFSYPIHLSFDMLRSLGFAKTIKIMVSFLWIRMFPQKTEKTLEDFIINRFGRQLYLLFFKDYTEKVWGKPPAEISAEWGAQRIKGVSLGKALYAAIQGLRRKQKGSNDLRQKGTETSLIEQFLYPKLGTGSMWEAVAMEIEKKGGKIHYHQTVAGIEIKDSAISCIRTVETHTGHDTTWQGDYFFSTMPVQELIAGMGETPPVTVREIAAGLQYRDFINVGLLLTNFSMKAGKVLALKDNWIYVQERDVKVGRIMIYNNWGGSMVKDPNTVWIGMEYFCNKSDALWSESDNSLQKLAIEELERMDLAQPNDILDGTVQRMEKTYPAYFGTYDQFDTIRAYTDQFANLFLIGRNGMHKYNNADHSMLTAMVAVDNIAAGILDKANIWAINTEQEYHEEKLVEKAKEGISSSSKEADAVRKHGLSGQLAFPGYIWGDKWNRGYLLFAAFAFLIQFILFKFKYPYANYMPDSYSYLEAAYINVDVNMWPVAYSKFLRLISVFTHSDKLVVGIQYVFMQTSALCLLFTVLFFLKPGRWVKGILLVFFLFNPIPLYVCNYISADALFTGMSMFWLTCLLWIIFKPRLWQIWIQGLLLLACFTIRYNAIYYPLIGALAFLLSRQNWQMKLSGIAFGTILVIGSIFYTSQKMQEVTGKKQFSAFGGWQLANNALYMYEHIAPTERVPAPTRFAKLDEMVRQHMDTLSKVKYTHEDSITTYFYLWSERGPLIQYMTRQYRKDSTTPYFKRWSSVAPLYEEYALYLIKKYPAAFTREFILPNAAKFAVPPQEFLGIYNMGQDSVQRIAKDWFNYKSLRVNEHNEAKRGIRSVQWYPVFSALTNVLVLLSLIGMFFFDGFRHETKGLTKFLILISAAWFLNAAFSIGASPVVLRYQVFPILFSFTLAVFVIDYLYHLNPSHAANQ